MEDEDQQAHHLIQICGRDPRRTDGLWARPFCADDLAGNSLWSRGAQSGSECGLESACAPGDGDGL